MSFANQVQSLDHALSLLSELSSSWGASSVETRKLAMVRSRCDAEAKVLEEIAHAMSTDHNKSAEELAQSAAFLKRVVPSVDITNLEAKLDEIVTTFQSELKQALTDEDLSMAASRALSLEKCNRADLIEEAFEETRTWQVGNFKDWCHEAKRERIFASKTMPNSLRATLVFEKAALASIQDLATFLREDDPRKRASKVKTLAEALPDLKDACGSSHAAKAQWESVLASMRAQTKLDAERAAKEHPTVKWSSTFHGVDPACLEVFGLLSRAGSTSEPPQTVLVALLDRLRDSARGRESDTYVLLGLCNSLDYILGYLDEYTPERTRSLAMLRANKEGFVKKACAELDRNGEAFVKQSGRFFQVQNPVLRTELRLEVSKAWKNANLVRRQSSGDNNNNSNSSAVQNTFGMGDEPSTATAQTQAGGGASEVGSVVALFFEGT